MKLRYPIPPMRGSSFPPLCDLEDCSVYYDPQDIFYRWLFVWGDDSAWMPEGLDNWVVKVLPGNITKRVPLETINHVRALTNLLYP